MTSLYYIVDDGKEANGLRNVERMPATNDDAANVLNTPSHPNFAFNSYFYHI
jgi:hypothetical protein